MSIMSYSDLEHELTRVSYRPGWTFKLYPHEHEGTWIAIEFEVVDAYHPDKMQRQCVRSPIPAFLETPEEFHRWLLWRLIRQEIHEAGEFYRVDGKVFRDPHREGANDG